MMLPRSKLPKTGKVLATYEELKMADRENPVPYEGIETDVRPVPGGPPVGVYFNDEQRWLMQALVRIRGVDAFELLP